MVLDKKGQSGALVIAGGAVLLIAVIVGLFILTSPLPITGGPTTQTQLAHFSSYEELLAAFQKGQNTDNSGGLYRTGVVMNDAMNQVAAPMVAKGAAESTAGAVPSPSATSHSTTNNQVAGVDEADIIKNDGKYVYAITNGKLFIVNAYPAQDANIISSIDFNGQTPNDLFISQDSSKLIVFTNSYGGYYPYYGGMGVAGGVAVKRMAADSVAAPSIAMPWRGYSGSSVMIYNISDKSTPVLEKQLDFEGSYLNSRLIGNTSYFVINSYPDYPTPCYNSQGMEVGCAQSGSDDNSIIPLMRIDGTTQRIAQSTEIGIMPRVRPQSFVTIGSFNLDNLEFNKETVAGSADNLYASQNNLYLAEPIWDYADYNGPIPLEAGMLMKSIYFPNIGTTQKMAINKFHLENGIASFVGQGIAPGSILNQYSMDEYNDNFRIATTVSDYGTSPNGMGENMLKNNVYVFGSDMNMVGAIEGIAPNETIYSARFMGDKGYLVTFKTVDPLFVLDLSNPTDPKILGKLKIPGYSDYMQPIDETHILGIGKDVNEETDAEKIHTPGAVYYTAIKGVKMAIFDVSDVANPKEMYKVVIGDRGTESEALSDPKALLFDIQKNLLVLPITLVENVSAGEANGQQTFQGAFVYNVSLDSGFTERGRITHVTAEEEMKTGYYYDYSSQIRRSLYMDNVLYTFSNNKLKANDLDTLAPISEVAFPAQDYGNTNSGYGGVEPPPVPTPLVENAPTN